MITPARALLGRRYAGQKIGYRVLSLDRSPVTGFTTAGVVESAPGHFAAAVNGPAAGGWIVWGTAGNPYIAEAALPPAPPTVDLSPIREALDAMSARLIESIKPPPVIVDTSAFDHTIAVLSADLLAAYEAERAQRVEAVTAMVADVADLRERVRLLDGLNHAAEGVDQLSEAAGRFNDATEIAARFVKASGGIADLGVLIERLTILRDEMTKAHDAGRAILILDNLLSKLEPA